MTLWYFKKKIKGTIFHLVVNIKITTITIFLFIYAQSANAGSCQMLLTEIDNKFNKIEKIKDTAKIAYNEADHAKYEELLNKAQSILNNWLIWGDNIIS